MFENDKITGEVTTMENSGADAAPQDSPETEMNALEKFMTEMDNAENEADSPQDTTAGENANQEHSETTETPASEVPKGIKGRIQAAEAKADARGYERGRTEAMREWETTKAEYEQKLAKYAEMELENDAKELAAKEKCSVDLAKRLLRMERGMTKPAAEKEESAKESAPTRDAKGRFVSRENDAGTDVQARAQALYDQAQAVQKSTGIDVLELFQTDAEVKRAVVSGEKDFKDIALERLAGGNKGARKPAPKPVSSGGAEAQSRVYSFKNMTDEEFDRFNRRLDQGAVVRFQ